VSEVSAVDEKLLERFLKTVIKTGKYTLGLKETLKSLKGAKVVVYSSSVGEAASRFQRLRKSSSTTILPYPGSSVRLGRLCGLPFKVSAISIKSLGDADPTPLTKDVREERGI